MGALTDENPGTIECDGIQITRGDDNQFTVAVLKDGVPMMRLDNFTLEPHQSQVIENLQITLPVRTR